MKPGARSFITYFLLNAESTARLDHWLIEHPGEQDRRTLGGLGFRWRYDVSCRVYDREMPETAVAYEESWIEALYGEHALAIEGAAARGSGRSPMLEPAAPGLSAPRAAAAPRGARCRGAPRWSGRCR
jgi:hypothetical protein